MQVSINIFDYFINESTLRASIAKLEA
jgi:hypothetical protein